MANLVHEGSITSAALSTDPLNTSQMASSPDSTSDLLEYFKQDAEISPGCTLQITYQSKPGISRRKVKVEKRWRRGKEIGRGTFGTVWLEVEQKDGGASTQRAVKEVSKSLMRNLRIDYKRELLALSRLSRYPREFVDFYGWYEDNDNVFLAMEYYPYGDLDNYIAAGFSECEAKSITLQLLEGLAVMHQNHFTHRDLKPQNIFVYAPSPQWWVKIGDFGITKRVAGEQTGLYTQTGTPLYRAPEISGFVDEGDDSYTNAVDMWSLGCVTYKLLAQKVPFANARAIMRFCSGMTSFPADVLQDKDISKGGISFLRNLLVPDSSKRLTINAALQASWLEESEGPPSPSLTELEGSELSEILPALKLDSKEHDARSRVHNREAKSTLGDTYVDTNEQWQQSVKELEQLRLQHTQLSAGMEEIIRHEIDNALKEKNLEIERSRLELESYQKRLKELQFDGVLHENDIDYFEMRSHQLYHSAQTWIVRFSKFSDMRPCRLISEIRDEGTVNRFDSAILDGSDVESYLADRIKRRDVFMTVMMTIIWEYVFTRYLFGLDRESRQKLKSLEKELMEAGPPGAVKQWRALTLTLLSNRPPLLEQSAHDLEAVVEKIYSTLATLLPPPHHLENNIKASLRGVIKNAVNLSIDMRTQREEYMMLPPLLPEYNSNGDLTSKVLFNAAFMNERSGAKYLNEELEAQKAVVRMALFPLVIQKIPNDEEIVVYSAQVLVQPTEKRGPLEST